MVPDTFFGTPTPKIIDFGVAKAIGGRLTDRTLTTGFAQMLGTPLYMSPEQAELSPLGVDTRSDVYSLGVLLYELLTGATPFDKDRLYAANYDEVRRIIREEEPPRPSARISTLAADAATTIAARRRTDPRRLIHTVRGELDWIVMKAIDKDRNRRYESAAELARDIERHLANEPVHASPPSATYHIRKFIRRHRIAVAILIPIVSGLLLGLSGVTVGLVHVQTIARELDASLTSQKEVTQRLQLESERRSRQQYISDMNAAILAYEENDLDRVERLLRRYSPRSRCDHQDLRGPEWYFLWKGCERAWSTRQFVVTETYAEAAALSPDRITLALGLVERPLMLLNLQSGHQTSLRQLQVNWDLFVAFSSDGRLLASPSDDATGVYVRDLQSGNEQLIHAGTRLLSVAFAPNHRTLAAGSAGDVFVWNLDKPNDPTVVPVSSSKIWNVAFSPDGELLLAGDDDGSLSRIDLAETKVVWSTAAHEGRFTSLVFSPDGRLLVTGSHDRRVAVWDARSHQRLAVLRGHEDFVRGVAFSPINTNLLASAARSGAVILWDLGTFSERATLRGISNGNVVCFASDGKSLITEDTGRVAVWPQAADYVDAIKTVAVVKDIAISPDDRLIVCLNEDREDWRFGPITIRDAATTEVLDSPFNAEERFSAIAVSPQNVLAAASQNGRVYQYDLDRHKLQELLALQSGVHVTSAEFSRSGASLGLGSRDGTVEVWQVQGGKTECVFSAPGAHADVVARLAFSPDGTLLATASRDHTVKVWEVDTGSLIYTFREHPYWATALAFTPDGRHIASGGWGDAGTVYIWEPRTGRIQNQFDGDTDSIRDLLFLSQDTLVTACGDNRIKFIDVQTGEQRIRFEGHTDAVECIAASSDGELLVSGGRWDNAIRFWRAATEEEVRRAEW